MGSRNSFISESTREEIAKELGVYDTVKEKGWGAVSSKDCGNIVKLALERSNQRDNKADSNNK